MPKIICKFKLNSIKRFKSGEDELQDIEMSPVYSSDPESENGQFWKWTPSGKLEVATVNADAVAGLELGKEYYIIITDQKPE